MVLVLLWNSWYFLLFTGESYLFKNRFKCTWVSVPAAYSYCHLDCSGIGNHSQGANINISLNLMNLPRSVIALTFNIHQIIENYMTPISHFDVHGTWAVCIWLTSRLVTGLPLCKVIPFSKPSLLIAAHLSFSWICFRVTSIPSHFSLDCLCCCACSFLQLTVLQPMLVTGALLP